MDILTVPEVAKYLRMSKSKVYEMVKQKEIPSIRIGRNIRIREADFMRWLDKKTQPESQL